MSFRDLIEGMHRKDPGIRGGALAGSDGLPVEEWQATPQRHDIAALCAEMAQFFKESGRIAAENGLGAAREVHVAGEEGAIFATRVTEEYMLLLVADRLNNGNHQAHPETQVGQLLAAAPAPLTATAPQTLGAADVAPLLAQASAVWASSLSGEQSATLADLHSAILFPSCSSTKPGTSIMAGCGYERRTVRSADRTT